MKIQRNSRDASKNSLKSKKRTKINKNQRKLSYPFFIFFLMFFSTLIFNPQLMTSPLAITTNNTTEIANLNNNVESSLTLLSRYPQSENLAAKGLEIRDNKLYSIIGNNPTIINVSDRTNPTLIADYEVKDGRFNTLTISSDYLYLGGTYGLEILDISDINNITKVGSYNTTTPDQIWAIILQNNYAYLAAEDNGLLIINISNPSQPEELGCYNTNLSAYDVALVGNYALIANSNTSGDALTILDISNPTNPIEFSSYEDDVYTEIPGFGIEINESYAYLGTFGFGMFILDISDISNPKKISHFYHGTEEIGGTFNEERVRDFEIFNQYLFEAVGPNGLYVLDISDPTNVQLLDEYEGHYIFSCKLVGTTLYVQELFDGVLIFEFQLKENSGLSSLQIVAIVISSSIVVAVIIISIILKLKKKK